jgi:hypothetical protein
VDYDDAEKVDAMKLACTRKRLTNKPYVVPMIAPRQVAKVLLADVYASLCERVAAATARHQQTQELRSFGAEINNRSVLQKRSMARSKQIIIRMMSGEELSIVTLVPSDTYFEFYREARRALGLDLVASPISLALRFVSSYREQEKWTQFDIVEPQRVLCLHAVRGCCFLAVVYGVERQNEEEKRK